MGWMVTEIGRQPWIIYNVVRTAAALTPAPGLVISFYVSTAIYIVLGVVCGLLLLRLAVLSRREGAGELEGEEV